MFPIHSFLNVTHPIISCSPFSTPPSFLLIYSFPLSSFWVQPPPPSRFAKTLAQLREFGDADRIDVRTAVALEVVSDLTLDILAPSSPSALPVHVESVESFLIRLLEGARGGLPELDVS